MASSLIDYARPMSAEHSRMTGAGAGRRARRGAAARGAAATRCRAQRHPQPRHRALRHQAVERARHARRPRRRARLRPGVRERHRQRRRGARVVEHGRARHARVHGARAGRSWRGELGKRLVQRGRDAVPGADRPAAVRGQQPRHPRSEAGPAAAPAVESRRTCRRICRRSR